MFEKESRREITCFRIFEDLTAAPTKIYIGLGMDDDSFWIENPFMSNTVEFWGINESATYDYIAYIYPDGDNVRLFPIVEEKLSAESQDSESKNSSHHSRINPILTQCSRLSAMDSISKYL